MKFNKCKIFMLSCLCVLTSMMNTKPIQASETNKMHYPKVGKLEIQKIDDDTLLPIEGAKFELWEEGKKVKVAAWESTSEKKIIDVELNKTYILKEIQSAQGYEKADDIVIKPDKDTTVNNDGIIVTNPTVQYTGLRHNGVRYITDGHKFQVVYCLNEEYINPNNIDLFNNNFDAFSTNYPKYVNKTLNNIKGEELYDNQKYTFYKDGLANVLLEGYPTNISNLQGKYGLSNSEAYTTTQNLIYAVLKNDLKVKETNTNMEKVNNMMKYYNDLLNVYQEGPHKNARAYIDIFSWIPNTGRPENQEIDKAKYQMLVGITNFNIVYYTKVISTSKKKATSLETDSNTRGDDSNNIISETSSEKEMTQPKEDIVVDDTKDSEIKEEGSVDVDNSKQPGGVDENKTEKEEKQPEETLVDDSEVKEENFADVDNGKQLEAVDENISEKEENQSEEDIVVDDTNDLEIKDETSTDIDDSKQPEAKKEVVVDENVSSNGKGEEPKHENSNVAIVKEEQKIPLNEAAEKQEYQSETKNTKLPVMEQKKDSVKSADKKASKANEKVSVNTSDQTNTYMWWLITVSAILMVICSCKYKLYKKSDK